MNKLPPGPGRGSGHALLQSMWVFRDPFATYERSAARYGDPFTLPTLHGDLVVTADPAGIKEIFAGDPSGFAVWAADAFTAVLGESSLIVVSGEPHTRLRKLLAPPFNGANMRAFAESIHDVTLREVGRWTSGERVQVHASMQAISFEVTARAVFGMSDARVIDQMREAVVAMLVAANPALLFFDVVLKHDLFDRVRRRVWPWARARRAVERVDELLYAQICARRADPRPPTDILGMMMISRYDDGSSMTDRELRDQLLSLLIAGHETTASALAWALYRIHERAHVREHIVSEVDRLGSSAEPHALAEVPYLDAVCQETLRLHPVVTEASRLLRKPLALKGYHLPAGVSVAAAIALLHANPALYPDPRSFRPERFLERTYSKFEFIPFGGGARRCIGAAFAMYEMKIVLGTILGACDLAPAWDGAIPTVRRGGVTMGPGGGVPMTFGGRRHAGLSAVKIR